MKNGIKSKEYYAHTSVNLSYTHIELLKATATENNLSINGLMILLLRYVNEHPILMASKSQRVRYQNDGINAKTVNLYIGQSDYERNLDSRRYGKVSVSWLLAFAIDHFLSVVLKEFLENLALGINILNNKKRPIAILIKKKHGKLKMTSIWYPMRA